MIRSKAGQSNTPTIIFLGMVVFSLSIRMVLGGICVMQEFFLIALFSVGCGGIYGIYIENLNIEIFSRYKLVGSAGISVALLLIAPAENQHSSECKSILTQIALESQVNFVENLYARQSQSQGTPGLTKLDTSVIKIFYPIGKEELEQNAQKLRKIINRKYEKARVTIWSKGTYRDAVINKFKDFPNTIRVCFRQKYGKGQKENLFQCIRQLENFKIKQEENNLKVRPSEDITIEMGL